MVVLIIGVLWIFFANQRPAPTVYFATATVHSAATVTKQTANTSYQSIINNESVDDPFRVAFVTSGRIDDHAFSQSMYEQLLKLQKEMGEDQFEFVSSDGMYVVDEASAVIQDYASQDFDLVVIHGSQYESAIQQIAPNYPEVSFAWGNSQETFGYDNVFAYDVYAQEGGYVLGVMAAALNRSGVIGIVNPIEFGDAKLYTEGFIAGVKATNPYITVNVINAGSYIDVALAAESAQAHVAAGADILTGSGQMVVGAIEVARINGVLWFGTQADQTSISPEIVVANQIYDWSIILRDMISLINEGNLEINHMYYHWKIKV